MLTGRRILALNWRDPENPEAGGAETHLYEILRRLADAGNEILWLAAGFAGGAAEAEIGGIRVVRAGGAMTANYVLPRVARRLLRVERFDAIVEDVNKIPFFLPWISKLPHLLVVPHLFGSTVFRETNPFFAAYVYLFERLIPVAYGRSRVIAISPSTREDLIARGLDGDRIAVSYCGFAAAAYDLESPPPRGESPRLIHLGRIRRYKGLDLVLRSFALLRERFPDAVLDVVGDGPERRRLARLAGRLGIGDAVVWHGHLPLAEMVALLYRSHIFLNASPKEGWGLTVIEAAACGVPSVAADSPGLRDSVRDGETGLLVPYGDCAAMADAAAALLLDPERREAMGRAAALRAREFSWDDAAREAAAQLELLIDEAGA